MLTKIRIYLNWKVILSLVVVIAMVLWLILMPRSKLWYVRIPEGYNRVNTGPFSIYNDAIVTGYEVCQMSEQFPECVILVRYGKSFVELKELKFVNSDSKGKVFHLGWEYSTVAIAKDGVVRGFAFQSDER